MQFFHNTIDLSERVKKVANETKTLAILVGPPSVGKSTWTKKNMPNAFILSRDDVVEQVASEVGLTYDDLFASPDQDLPVGHVDSKFGKVIDRPVYLPKFLPPKVWDKVSEANSQVHKRFQQRIEDAKNSGQDIVVDMTNMNTRARKGMLSNFSGLDGYTKKVVNFSFEGDDVQSAIKDISKERARQIAEQGGSKNIPDDVFDSMFGRYQKPSLEEGFDELVEVDDRQRILDQARGLRESL
jgi:hypothetical protein